MVRCIPLVRYADVPRACVYPLRVSSR